MLLVVGEVLVGIFLTFAVLLLGARDPGLAAWVGRLLLAIGVLNYFIWRARYEKLRKKFAKVIKYEKMRSKLAAMPKP
jgi:hypothetical protein